METLNYATAACYTVEIVISLLYKFRLLRIILYKSYQRDGKVDCVIDFYDSEMFEQDSTKPKKNGKRVRNNRKT